MCTLPAAASRRLWGRGSDKFYFILARWQQTRQGTTQQLAQAFRRNKGATTLNHHAQCFESAPSVEREQRPKVFSTSSPLKTWKEQRPKVFSHRARSKRGKHRPTNPNNQTTKRCARKHSRTHGATSVESIACSPPRSCHPSASSTASNARQQGQSSTRRRKTRHRRSSERYHLLPGPEGSPSRRQTRVPQA